MKTNYSFGLKIVQRNNLHVVLDGIRILAANSDLNKIMFHFPNAVIEA